MKLKLIKTKTKLMLNLGCGKEDIKDYIGIDKVNFGFNRVIDIERKGLMEFKNDSVDRIRAHAFLEHISQENIIYVMNECWRVLKKEGEFEIVVPDITKGKGAFSDPTHCSFWSDDTFTKYFTCKEPKNADYGISPWIIERLDRRKHTLFVILKKNESISNRI